jgi:predicted nucleic-acid-binding protein
MIGLDTNVLARYYVDDSADREAMKQRRLAQKLVESGKPLWIAKSVLLEFEWVLRGYYEFSKDEVARVFAHLLSSAQVTIEDLATVQRAVDGYVAGLDFADALHHASAAQCVEFATFDDKGFAKKAMKLAILPRVVVPKN